MVDNRAAGYFGIGGAFNFKSGDISGTAARTQDDKMGQGGEYFAQQQQEELEEEQNESKYMDRSAVLRATLNSLAMMNVANVINARKIEAKKQKDLLATQQLLKKKHEESLHNGSINSSEDVLTSRTADEEIEDVVD